MTNHELFTLIECFEKNTGQPACRLSDVKAYEAINPAFAQFLVNLGAEQLKKSAAFLDPFAGQPWEES
jgi:hypothetical protein